MNLFKDKLKQFLIPNKTFDKKDLWNFYINHHKKSSEQDFFWYLYNLREEKIIKTVDKDSYQLVNDKSIFSPKIDVLMEKICQKLRVEFGIKTYCVWSSNWLNEFTIHQNMRNLILLEVEKDVAESVYYALKDMNYPNIFLLLQKADEMVMIERYIFEAQNPIVIRKIISKSPVKRLDNDVIVPKLEKILVDIFCDESLFIAYKGHERDIIFRNVLKEYDINLKTMFAYARRRKKEEHLKTYLYQNFQSEIETLL